MPRGSRSLIFLKIPLSYPLLKNVRKADTEPEKRNEGGGGGEGVRRGGKGKKEKGKKGGKKGKSGTSGREGGYFWTGEVGSREVVGQRGRGRER